MAGQTKIIANGDGNLMAALFQGTFSFNSIFLIFSIYLSSTNTSLDIGLLQISDTSNIVLLLDQADGSGWCKI